MYGGDLQVDRVPGYNSPSNANIKGYLNALR
jgi:hypothetical protein